ncbi:hypothetical protein F5Y19DRAFT_478217 [Xylariaceae sp. FL1651]|nr:hypothetical protein F5Y19DRAFT_478217 [Xylariaceae sp. FL1651]
MSAAHKKACPQASSRKLFKGTLSLPCIQPTRKSYTVAPASISEVSIKDPAGNPAVRRQPIAISSTAVAQPFVDPAVLQRRLHDPTTSMREAMQLPAPIMHSVWGDGANLAKILARETKPTC